MSSILSSLKSEPARIGAMITAVIALLIDLGVSLDPEIALRLTALAAIVFGEGVRSQVSPASKDQPDFVDVDPSDYDEEI